MCKQDPCQHLLQLDANLEQVVPAFGCEAKKSGTPHVAITIDACLASDTVSCDETACNTAIFFARVPPMVPYDDLHALFSKFGTVQHLNLFRRWATAKASKGCGTVQYSKAEEASAAMLALNGLHTFEDYPGSEAGPMVVEWMDASRLTAPPAAAGTVPKAAKAPPRTSAKPQQKPRPKGASSGSNSSSSSSSMAGWQYMQQLTAFAQQSRAVAAAAAAAATGFGFLQQGGLGGAHPALEALDVSGLLPHPVSDSNSAGLDDPVSWGSVVPVYLLPMATTAQTFSPVGSANMSSWSPLMPSAAAAAAATAAPASAVSQMTLSPTLQPSVPGSGAAASTPGHMLSPGSSSSAGCGDDLISPDAPEALPGPAFRPWFSGALPTQTDSSNLSLAAGSSFAPASSSFIAAAAAEQRRAEQQLQQSTGPLIVLEDMWDPQSCEGLASAASNTASRHVLSGSQGLFESMPLLGQLNEAAAAAAAASVGANTCGAIAAAGHAGNQQHCVSQADACEFVSGGMSGFLTGEGLLSGFLSQNSLAAVPSQNSLAAVPSQNSLGAVPTRDAAAGSFPEGYPLMPLNGNMGSSSTQPQRLQESDIVQAELHAPTAGESLGQLVVNIPHIAKITGAKIQTTVGPVNTQFKLQGSAAEVEAACKLMQLLSPIHTAVV